jgi:hypothetical protein
VTKKPVGYKNPPEHTRWKKGQSGNPAGRCKGQRDLKTDLAAELREVVQITEAGVPRRITKQRALLKGLTARAIGGDSRAANLMLNLMLRLLDQEIEAPVNIPLSSEDKALLDAFFERRASKEDRS